MNTTRTTKKPSPKTHKAVTPSPTAQHKAPDVSRLRYVADTILGFIKRNWLGAVVLLIVTCAFFWPIITHISSYSEGGDAMFNSWTLARDQNCILRHGCPSYADGNIFFPHKNSMLYSETQLSAGVITLPLYFINDNPIFSYNVMTVASFFLMAFFMYLLAKYLSKGREIVSILAGVLFAYSPFRMGALSHLQNSSIFYLPLAFLLIFKFFDTKKRGYLVGLFVTLALQFYASWYQMVYVLIALGILLGGYWLFKLAKPKVVLSVFVVVCLAAISTAPLAKSYANFSKSNSASFSIQSQTTYSASLIDYVTPEQGTLLGKLFYHLKPTAHRNSYNPDSHSYYGLALWGLAIGLIALAYRKRKRGLEAMQEYKKVVIFALIGLAGVIISFGPVLKIRGAGSYDAGEGLRYAIAMPYILVSKFLPQLSFMRALGRAGVLILFALCCFLALAPLAARNIGFYQKHKRLINILLLGLIVFELIPFHRMPMRTTSYNYNLSVPPVYKFIKNDDQINNIVVLAADFDYPGSGGIPTQLPEVTMWAGYHNKNVFNGYSGYLPPDYYPTYWNFLDFQADDVALLKQKDLRYVMVDKQLSTTNPDLAEQVGSVLGKENIVYQDQRYVIFKVPQ